MYQNEDNKLGMISVKDFGLAKTTRRIKRPVSQPSTKDSTVNKEDSLDMVNNTRMTKSEQRELVKKEPNKLGMPKKISRPASHDHAQVNPEKQYPKDHMVNKDRLTKPEQKKQSMTDSVRTKNAASQASTKDSLEKKNHNQSMMKKNEVAKPKQKKLMMLSEQ